MLYLEGQLLTNAIFFNTGTGAIEVSFLGSGSFGHGNISVLFSVPRPGSLHWLSLGENWIYL